MKVPNADKAEIAPEKLRDYLLNLSHRRGGTKARLLGAYGYDAVNWKQLERDLREQHLQEEVASEQESTYGRVFVITAPLTTPSGRSVRFHSVWQIDTGTEHPRLITMYPE